MQPLRVPSVGRHGPPPHQPSIRSSPLYPLNTPEDPTGPQTESPRESREPTSAIRGPRPEGARRPTGPQANSEPSHRIKPPRSQTIADLSRQRARWPKAPPQAASLPATSASPSTPRVESRAVALQTGPRPPSVPRWPSPPAAPSSGAATPAQESHEARRRPGPLGACRGIPRRFLGFLPLIHLGHIAHSRALRGPARGAGIPSHGGPNALGRAHRHRRNDRSKRSRRTSASPDGTRSASSVSSSGPWPGIRGGPISLFATGAREGASRPSFCAG